MSFGNWYHGRLYFEEPMKADPYVKIGQWNRAIQQLFPTATVVMTI